MAIDFNPGAAFESAVAVADEQEAQARALLWERITAKAGDDPQFRQRLIDQPKDAVKEEAARLGDVLGQDKEVAPAVVEKVAARAKAVYSSIVPEVASDKVEKLIFGTIEDLKRSFNLTLLLSQVLFYSGLAMIGLAFILALFQGKETIALLFGAGGIATALIAPLLISPMDRVQNAAGHLVQLQMAYLAYYKQLFLLGGGKAPSSRDDAVAYAKEIDRAAISLISSIQTYVALNPKTKLAKPPAAPKAAKKIDPAIKPTATKPRNRRT